MTPHQSIIWRGVISGETSDVGNHSLNKNKVRKGYVNNGGDESQ